MVSTIKKDLEPLDDVMEGDIDLPYQQIRFMTGKELRDITREPQKT